MALALAWENDFARDSRTAMAFGIFGLLELAALLRYPNTVDWSKISAWIWAFLAVSFMVAGFYIWWVSQHKRRTEPTAAQVPESASEQTVS